MSTGSQPAPLVHVSNGSRTFTFYDNAAFKQYLSVSPPTSSTGSVLSSLLEEFNSFPRIGNVLPIYFEEALRSLETGLRLSPAILIGCASELLILNLLKAAGEFLEDTNAVQNYLDVGKNIQQKMDYTRTMFQKCNDQIQGETLSAEEQIAFREFNTVVERIFDSIRLRRNEYCHPTPDMTLDELPKRENIETAYAMTFNPYSKVILTIIDVLRRIVENRTQTSQ